MAGVNKADNTVKTQNIKPAAQTQPKAEVKKAPEVQTAPKAPADKAGFSAEATKKEKGNAGHLDALKGTFGPNEPAKTKEGDKPKEGEKAKEGEKPEDGKKPETKEQKIENLQDELKQARARGDKEAIARIEAELKKLQQGDQPGAPAGEAPAGPGAVAPGGGAPAGGAGAPAGGGGAPAGGGGAPAGGGGAPAGGGGAPAGGGGGPAAGGGPGAPAGGANEAGAGQGAGAGKEEVDQFIQFAAQAYGADPKVLSEIARRESNFNTGDIANNWDSNAKKGTPSKGMFQFIEPTARDMMPKAKAANPQAWQGVSESWTDWKAQALTTAWAITHGKGSHWSTYQAAVQTAQGGGGGTRNA
jgi:hypothetical protein